MRVTIREAGSPAVRIGFMGDTVPGFPEHREIRLAPSFQELLAGCDLILANLEAPLTSVPPQKEKGIPVYSVPEAVAELVRLKITHGNLANNHVMDCGREGLVETLRLLDENGIVRFGAGASREEADAVRLAEAGGCRLAFLGYSWTAADTPSMASGDTPGANPFVLAEAKRRIAALRREGHIVCVSYHGGEEHFHVPGPTRRAVLRELAQAGAQLVIGHHAHLIQAVEAREGAVIAYGLGNFHMVTSGQSIIRGTDIGLLLVVELDANGPTAYETHLVQNDRKEHTLSFVRGPKGEQLALFHQELSDAVADEAGYRRSWRRDCVRMALGLNDRSESWWRRTSRMARIVVKLAAANLFGKKPIPGRTTEPDYKSTPKGMIAAAVRGLPEALLHFGRTTGCTRAYDMENDARALSE